MGTYRVEGWRGDAGREREVLRVWVEAPDAAAAIRLAAPGYAADWPILVWAAGASAKAPREWVPAHGQAHTLWAEIVEAE